MNREALGFSLPEVAVVIFIVGVLAMVAIPKFMNLDEDAEAKVLDSIHTQLQVAIKEGSDRGYTVSHMSQYSGGSGSLAGITQNLLELPPGVTLTTGTTSQVSVNFPRSSRSGTLSISSAGQVTVSALSGFTNHSIVNGRIQ